MQPRPGEIIIILRSLKAIHMRASVDKAWRPTCMGFLGVVHTTA